MGVEILEKTPNAQWLELAAHTWPAYSESLVGHAGLGDFEGQKGQLGTNVMTSGSWLAATGRSNSPAQLLLLATDLVSSEISFVQKRYRVQYRYGSVCGRGEAVGMDLKD